jgi:hypothetical protein
MTSIEFKEWRLNCGASTSALSGSPVQGQIPPRSPTMGPLSGSGRPNRLLQRIKHLQEAESMEVGIAGDY